MIYFLALIPATGLTVGGYIVLYLSSRMEGGLRSFGKYLAFWAFTLAALVILGAVFAAAHHHHRRGEFGGRGMHHRTHGPWGGPGAFGPRFEPPPPSSGSAAPPGAPAAPAGTAPPAPGKAQ